MRGLGSVGYHESRVADAERHHAALCGRALGLDDAIMATSYAIAQHGPDQGLGDLRRELEAMMRAESRRIDAAKETLQREMADLASARGEVAS